MQKVMCDRTGEPAKYAYEWAWGEKGYCSESGKGELQQLAVNLSQQVAFAPLVTNEIQPVGRDERAQLMGRIQALEFELDEVSKKAAELVSSLERTQNEARGYRIANESWKKQVEASEGALFDLRARIVALEGENSQLLAAVEDYRDAVGADDVARLTSELDEAKAEIARLRAEPAPEPVPPTL